MDHQTRGRRDAFAYVRIGGLFSENEPVKAVFVEDDQSVGPMFIVFIGRHIRLYVWMLRSPQRTQSSRIGANAVGRLGNRRTQEDPFASGFVLDDQPGHGLQLKPVALDGSSSDRYTV